MDYSHEWKWMMVVDNWNNVYDCYLLEPVLVNAADGVPGVSEPGRQDEKCEKLIVLDLNIFQNMFRRLTYGYVSKWGIPPIIAI